jgi:hypothetical protein
MVPVTSSHILSISYYSWRQISIYIYEYIKNVINESIKTCYTLIYKIRYGKKLLLDIYAYTPIGVECIKTSLSLDVDKLFCFKTIISSIIGFIGPTNVVQLIINDDDEIDAPKDMFYYKYHCIYLTRCITSEIEFLQRKIYDISDVW